MENLTCLDAIISVEDGLTLATGGDRKTIYVSLSEGVQELHGHLHKISALKLISASFLVSASFDNSIRIWDPKLG